MEQKQIQIQIQKQQSPITLLFIAGGKSSRFGGEPKMLSKLGHNEESLFEISLIQVTKNINIDQLHLVLNKENQSTILHEVNHVIQKHNLNIRITYNIQEIPEHRSKPWGTADAIVSAKSHIHNQFLLVNSDDLYDAKTFELVQEECDFSKNYIIGFKLGTTLTSNNKANRAFISLDQDTGRVNELQENLNIEKANYTEEELNNQYVSVNLFLLQPEVLSIMEAELNVFKHANRDSDTIEAMLPDFLNFHIKHGEINMELLKSCGTWNGVTYKEDVEQVRDILSKCI